jgi:hypothetical protein
VYNGSEEHRRRLYESVSIAGWQQPGGKDIGLDIALAALEPTQYAEVRGWSMKELFRYLNYKALESILNEKK